MYFAINGMSRVYSNGSQFSPLAIFRAVHQPGNDRILLISGSQLPTIGDKAKLLCFGVYFKHHKIPLPPGIEECAARRHSHTWNKFPIVGEKSDHLDQPAKDVISRIFQCKPVHRVYQPLRESCGETLLEEDGKYVSIKFYLRTQGSGEVCLKLDENGQFGTFTMRWLKGKKVPEDISDLVFQVENVEVLEMGSMRHLEETFYIPVKWYSCHRCGGLKGDGVTCNRNPLH